MMFRGYRISLRTILLFALAHIASLSSIAVAQVPPAQVPPVQYSFPAQSPSAVGATPAQMHPGQMIPNPSAYPPGTTPNGPSLPQMTMNSKDFLKLMEEANAAKGLSVYSGNFPGARPVPKAPVVERPTPVPPAQQPEHAPAGTIATPSGFALPPVSPTDLGSPESGYSPRQLPLNFPQPQLPSPTSQGIQLPPPSLTTHGVPNNSIDSSMTPPGTVGLPHAAPPTPARNPTGTDLSSATMGSGLVSTDSVPMAPQNFNGIHPSSPYASPPHASPWPQTWPDPTNLEVPPGHPFQAQTTSNPTPQVQSRVPQASQRWNANAPKRTSSERQARFVASYFSNWLERTGDTSMSFSQSGSLGSFGTDQAGRFSLGYMVDPMECYEVSFLGSLSWNRELQSMGPVDSTLQSDDPVWLTHLQQATSQQQFHSATLRSYSLHKRLITDDLGNSYFGLGVIDYAEQYTLLSNGSSGSASMNIDTSNLWVGAQGGLELWRPLSQRLSVGAQGNAGLYANFADADWRADSGTGLTLNTSADKWNLAFLVGVNARARYRFNSYCAAYGGYEWTYLGGLATVDQQPIQTLSTTPSWNLTTNAGFLLQGAQCGLEFQY